MNTAALDFCLLVSLAHANLRLKLDDVLGTLHGLGFDDFRLLQQLALAPDGRLAVAALVRPLGIRPSAVMRQLLPLEKTGLVQREVGGHVVIRPAGRALVGEAGETAAAICESALGGSGFAAAQGVLSILSRSPALEL